MEVIINGKPEILGQQITLASLIEKKSFNPAIIVVEYNQKIVGKEEWGNIVLKNGDVLEIISFVGGG